MDTNNIPSISEKQHQKSTAREVIISLGVRRTTVYITIFSVVVSWLVTILMTYGLNVESQLGIALAIASICPLIIAPLVSYHIVSLIIRLDKAEKLALHLANYDSLTNATNRNYFYSEAPNLLTKIQSNKKFALLLMIDIDNFKTINDQFGHIAGDKALKNLCSLMQNQLNDDDLLARIGGDEFIVIISDNSQPNVIQRAKNFHQSITASPELTPRLTISLGGALLGNNGDTLETLIKFADRNLYRSKNNGRDQLTLGTG